MPLAQDRTGNILVHGARVRESASGSLVGLLRGERDEARSENGLRRRSDGEGAERKTEKCLPPEILFLVFMLVPATSLVRCERVNQRWRRVVVGNSNRLWNRLLRDEFGVDAKEEGGGVERLWGCGSLGIDGPWKGIGGTFFEEMNGTGNLQSASLIPGPLSMNSHPVQTVPSATLHPKRIYKSHLNITRGLSSTLCLTQSSNAAILRLPSFIPSATNSTYTPSLPIIGHITIQSHSTSSSASILPATVRRLAPFAAWVEDPADVYTVALESGVLFWLDPTQSDRILAFDLAAPELRTTSSPHSAQWSDPMEFEVEGRSEQGQTESQILDFGVAESDCAHHGVPQVVDEHETLRDSDVNPMVVDVSSGHNGVYFMEHTEGIIDLLSDTATGIFCPGPIDVMPGSSHTIELNEEHSYSDNRNAEMSNVSAIPEPTESDVHTTYHTLRISTSPAVRPPTLNPSLRLAPHPHSLGLILPTSTSAVVSFDDASTMRAWRVVRSPSNQPGTSGALSVVASSTTPPTPPSRPTFSMNVHGGTVVTADRRGRVCLYPTPSDSTEELGAPDAFLLPRQWGDWATVNVATWGGRVTVGGSRGVYYVLEQCATGWRCVHVLRTGGEVDGEWVLEGEGDDEGDDSDGEDEGDATVPGNGPAQGMASSTGNSAGIALARDFIVPSDLTGVPVAVQQAREAPLHTLLAGRLPRVVTEQAMQHPVVGLDGDVDMIGANSSGVDPGSDFVEQEGWNSTPGGWIAQAAEGPHGFPIPEDLSDWNALTAMPVPSDVDAVEAPPTAPIPPPLAPLIPPLPLPRHFSPMTLSQGPHHVLASGRMGDEVVVWDVSRTSAQTRGGAVGHVLRLGDVVRQVPGRWDELRFAELCGSGREVVVGAVRGSTRSGGTHDAETGGELGREGETLLCVWDFGAGGEPNIEEEVLRDLELAQRPFSGDAKGKGKSTEPGKAPSLRYRTRMWERVRLEVGKEETSILDAGERERERDGVEVWVGWEVEVVVA
ncbi:hypothetical protein M427DRAFT_139263 [Gonapodya prolifera JEL478]|uniref:F-box domain-containing protein n=1 Tax=Gonapodya prolifera (strain JEL478) TaxID=1344416 RepID=A0A139A2D5_GONPJ|nr:hypothetical protein M427DRAFT_139263 [Gonapodya prolifera JEL478]|eukprot:KXS10513.1 hypothetical protein M427DRAFT_139263 [Gonapodya prolifera JEL478]